MVRRYKSVQAAATLNLVLGLAVLVAPFAMPTRQAMLVSDVVVGLAVVVLAGHDIARAGRGRPDQVYATGAATVALGLWLLVAPFVTGSGNPTHNLVIMALGVVLIISAGYNSYAASAEREEMAEFAEEATEARE